MRYYLDLLDELKSGRTMPVYLFYGEETYLQEQAVANFRKKLLPPEVVDFNFDVLDGERVEAGEIVAAASSPPVMSPKRLVVVRDAVFFTPGRRRQEAGEKETGTRYGELLDYLNRPVLTTCLIFCTRGAIDRKDRLFRKVVENGRVVEFSRLKPAELARWLARRASSAGVSIRREAVEELVTRCGRSLQALSNEMEKLINYVGTGGTITVQDVREVSPPCVEDSIFDLVDAVGVRDFRRALEGMRNLLARRESPQVILAMVARQLRLLLQVKELEELEPVAGKSAAGLNNLHPYVMKKIRQQSRNFELEQLVRALDGLLEVDAAVKTGQLEFYPAMQMFLFKLCRN